MKPEQKAMHEKRLKKVKVVKKKGNGTLIAGIVAVLLLAAIAYAVLSGDEEKTEDIKLPSYAYTNPLTLKAYKYATEHPDILEQIPCYCGCGQHGTAASNNEPHRFVRDCFVNDNWEYDDHASFCDVCIGIAVKTQDYLASGKTLKEARALIDAEYGPRYADGKTNTPPVRDDYKPILAPKLSGVPKATAVQTTQLPSIDLSALSLPDNFKSLSDGLKFIPPGIQWAYFTNLKQSVGMEQNFMPDANFYGLPIVGMLNSEYSENSWVELHDVGKSNVNVKSNAGTNVDNILFTRPYVFSTKDRTNSVLALLSNPANENAYNSFKSLLEKVNDENAGFAKINTKAPSFANASYFGLVTSGNEITGEIGFDIKANATLPLTKYNELKNSSVDRGFKTYEVKKENNTLIIRMTSNLDTIISEATQNYEIDI